MHVVRRTTVASQPLPAPLRLVPEPAGLSASRVHHHRQIMIWNIQAGRADLLVQYGSHPLFDPYERSRQGSWEESADGLRRYRPPPPAPPVSVDQGEPQWDGPGPGTWGDPVRIALAPGVVTVAGLRLRLAWRGEDLTVQVIEDRSRPWVRLTCDRRSYSYPDPAATAG